jgi:hypothetical protein
MQRVIVTVKRQNEARVRDLEVPAEMPAKELAQTIARVLNWDINLPGAIPQYQIEAHISGKPGKVLQPDETLAGAGVWDGAWLVLQAAGSPRVAPSASVSRTVPTGTAQPTSGPLIGWRPLGIDLPGQGEQASGQNETQHPPGVEWKQLD